MHFQGECLLESKPGGSTLAEYLEWLRTDLDDYYGALAEMAIQVHNERAYHKPLALIRYEQCKSMGIPLIAGGVRDQPYIWLLEWAVVEQVKTVFDAINTRNAEADRNSANG